MIIDNTNTDAFSFGWSEAEARVVTNPEEGRPSVVIRASDSPRGARSVVHVRVTRLTDADAVLKLGQQLIAGAALMAADAEAAPVEHFQPGDVLREKGSRRRYLVREDDLYFLPRDPTSRARPSREYTLDEATSEYFEKVI